MAKSTTLDNQILAWLYNATSAQGLGQNLPSGTITASISGTTLTTTAGTPVIGQQVTGTSVAANTYITAGSGTSWTVSVSQTVASESMNVGPLTNIYVALHTADPTAAGTQASNEIAYTGYARVAVARTSSGWTVTGGTVNPATSIGFPPGTGGSGTAAFFSTGFASSGATEILHSGPISPTIITGAGVTPTLSAATAITEA